LKYVDQQNIITSLIKTTQVYEAEFYILEILDCSLVFYHPYRALTQLLKDFTKKTDKLSEDPLYKDAWKICNDYCLRTDCPLLYPPHLIAIAAIMIAATKTTNISESLKTWIAELCVDFEKV
jgi:cyclin C